MSTVFEGREDTHTGTHGEGEVLLIGGVNTQTGRPFESQQHGGVRYVGSNDYFVPK